MVKKILDTVHETAKGMHDAGVMNTITMREFDALCLPPVKDLTAVQIKRLRTKSKASQAVFAAYLNTSRVCRLPEHQSLNGAEMGAGSEEAQRSFIKAVEFGTAEGSGSSRLGNISRYPKGA